MNAALVSAFSGPAAVAMLVVGLKVALLVGVALVAAASLRRAPAAARHLVWLGAVGGALALAVLAVPVRGIGVTVPGWPAGEAVSAGARDRAELGDGSLFSTGAPLAATGAKASDAGKGEASLLVHAPAPPPSPSRMPLLALVWMAGAALVAGWMLLGYVGLSRLAASAAPVGDADWRSIVDGAARDLGVLRPIAIRRSAAVGTPIVCGWLRPTIVLPADAEAWPVERRRVVALHELAHVARGDAVAQALACLACALFWCHPVVWIAARRMRAESERACDDRVLAAGVPGADYASHLLGVARTARSLRLAGTVAIAMARRSTLEGRLLSLLDDRPRARTLSRGARVAALAGMGLCVAALACLRPVAADDRSGSHGLLAAGKGDRDRGNLTDGSSTVHRKPIRPGGRLVLDLRAGAEVEVRGWDRNEVEVRGTLGGPDWEDMRIEFDVQNDRAVVRTVYDGPRGRNWTSDNLVEIRVPKRIDIELESAGGGLTLLDLDGTMRGKTGGGDIVMERLRGEARLSTGGGEIHIDDCDMRGLVTTGGGLVRLSRVRGGLVATSGSGPVIREDGESKDGTGDISDVEVRRSGTEVGYADDDAAHTASRGVLNIDKAGGPIDVPSAPAGVRATTGGGEITIGRADRLVYAHTGGGDIQVGPASGSVTASTGAGDVRVTVARGGREARKIDVYSGKGTVVIELPRGLGATFELETAYTKGSGRRTSIQSDVPVDLVVDPEWQDRWDPREGSPRKYVRANATVGDGRVTIRVKTVNGDIRIRHAGS